MRTTARAALALTIVGFSSGASAQEFATPKPTPKPFDKLFLVPGQPGFRPLPLIRKGVTPTATARPSVSCGTTVVPVDPEFDAAIRRPAPTTPKPTVRTHQAPPCESAR